MKAWIKFFGWLTVSLGLICLVIGLQEAIAIKKGFLEYSLSQSLGGIIGEHSSIKQAKNFLFYSGIRHAFYGILLVTSGLGILLKKTWGQLLFLGFWLIVFISNIYFKLLAKSVTRCILKSAKAKVGIAFALELEISLFSKPSPFLFVFIKAFYEQANSLLCGRITSLFLSSFDR